MASKADRLKARAVATVRQPKSPALLRGAGKRGYKILGISVYTDELETVERLTRKLRDAGYPKVNRSFLFQAAIRRLEEELDGKSREEILQYFADREAKRARSA